MVVACGVAVYGKLLSREGRLECFEIRPSDIVLCHCAGRCLRYPETFAAEGAVVGDFSVSGLKQGRNQYKVQVPTKTNKNQETK